MDAEERRSEKKESWVARVFDIAGGISSSGLILTGILLLVALPSVKGTDRIVEAVIALVMIGFGAAAGFSRKLRKMRIVTGVVVVLLFVLGVVASCFFIRRMP